MWLVHEQKFVVKISIYKYTLSHTSVEMEFSTENHLFQCNDKCCEK